MQQVLKKSDFQVATLSAGSTAGRCDPPAARVLSPSVLPQLKAIQQSRSLAPTVLFEAFSLWPPDPRPRLRFLALALEVHINRLHQSPHKAGQAVRGHEHRRRAHTAARTGAPEAGRGGDCRRRPPRKRRRKDRPPGPPPGAVGAPAILSATPPARGGTKSRGEPEEPTAGDEFDDVLDDDLASESDALLVLRSYTSGPSGIVRPLPILRAGAEGAGSSVECEGAQVRMLLLVTAGGGNGNDPDNVTVVEAGSYLHAAGVALAHSSAGRESHGATSRGTAGRSSGSVRVSTGAQGAAVPSAGQARGTRLW
ncbi:hypothetical protein THAOC_19985 [Thalassiosira oceanica]|uniref:Uncharacterized protein n=1 Tax=Thalassiosira oceanica TaxID=159749 RepID=K0S3H7_THAOC|nr:hypothetical protein THAOC_19985 [Thalassiosira oceanica]|eukprot:EJK59755.1 hypothetical protein THAOC_19985 [Thalassiosira oceanica]